PGFTDNTVGTEASFRSPEGVASYGTDVYVADTGNHTIRKITPSGAAGSVTTFAGTVTLSGFVDNVAGLSARFSSPSSLAFVGTDLFVADSGNHVIRKIDTSAFSAFVTTLAGTAGSAGFADSAPGPAQFNGPKGIGILGTGANFLYVADTVNDTIRQVALAGTVTTVAGNPPKTGVADGTGTAARFHAPAGAAVIGDDVFVTDTENGTIRKITPSGVVTTVPGTLGPFASPVGIAVIDTTLYVCDNVNHTISSVPAAGGTVTILAGVAGNSGIEDGTGPTARFNGPRGIASDGTNLYVADTGNHTIREVTTSGTVTTLAGLAGNTGSADGTGFIARFNGPQGIAARVASLATTLYIADTGNHTVRRVSVSGTSGTASTFAGTAGTAGFADGSTGTALFSSPRGITSVGSFLYVADTGNHAIRRISTTATVSTFVGTSEAATTRDGDASQALLNAPVGIAGAEGTIFFTDANENVVRKILF
ncbi:MAG TPA: NHL repeat-containing protein, partial [Candidatus Limnocylindrales bacterium]|nr:NHL repeat-containing protein [Candidatus Limnocylindrales bacterium]